MCVWVGQAANPKPCSFSYMWSADPPMPTNMMRAVLSRTSVSVALTPNLRLNPFILGQENGGWGEVRI